MPSAGLAIRWICRRRLRTMSVCSECEHPSGRPVSRRSRAGPAPCRLLGGVHRGGAESTARPDRPSARPENPCALRHIPRAIDGSHGRQSLGRRRVSSVARRTGLKSGAVPTRVRSFVAYPGRRVRKSVEHGDAGGAGAWKIRSSDATAPACQERPKGPRVTRPRRPGGDVSPP